MWQNKDVSKLIFVDYVNDMFILTVAFLVKSFNVPIMQ